MPNAKINNININYRVTGHGEPLVMIMGLGSDQSGWNHQVPSFAKYYQVITFDPRGSGRSDKPKGPYTMKMLADDTVELMNHMGIEKAHLMGISMGGMIAQEVAINYPQRVMKLVLANTYAAQDKKANGPTREIAHSAKASSRNMGATLVNLAYNNPLNRFITIIRVKIRSRFTRASMKSANKFGFLGQLEACLKHDTLERLPSIKSPTLVIVGTLDKVIKPSSSEVIAGLIPNARLEQIQKGSHVMNIEKRKIFNQVIMSFLILG